MKIGEERYTDRKECDPWVPYSGSRGTRQEDQDHAK